MNRFLFLIIFLSEFSFAQKELIQSGPMLGYSGFREVLIWIQTNEEANIKISYYTDDKNIKYSNTYRSKKEDDFIIKIFPNDLSYGKKYLYDLYINDIKVLFDYKLEFETQDLWQYRNDPPSFSFAIGSCYYLNDKKDDRPGKGYGNNYEIFNSIYEKDPNFMLWLGDNIYLREPDLLTENGIRYRYKHARSLSNLKPLLANTHHYAIWDDHDYGPNDADRSYVNKKVSEKVFNNYWGNPNTNVTNKGGITGQFQWQDITFFLMDNRYHRAPNKFVSENKDYLGREQINWLIEALKSSNSPFKFVCIGGQVISDAKIYENYATYPEERKYLLKKIKEEKINGVIFLSGDRHHTEISKLERIDSYPLLDITCSPLTSKPYKSLNEGNTNLIKEKTFYERNFGIIKIEGPKNNRSLILSIYDYKGKKQWKYTINENDLK